MLEAPFDHIRLFESQLFPVCASDEHGENHALVMAAMESEAVLPDPKNLLLVLDEGHHLPDVARDALEMSAEITAPWFQVPPGWCSRRLP